MHDDSGVRALTDDPETVAALFEAAVPELPPPVAILREPDGALGVARFTVRTRGAAYRMKVGADAASCEAVRTGARSLDAFAARGLSVARSLALDGVRHPGPVDRGSSDRGPTDREPADQGPAARGLERPTVAVETRLGTTDAAIAWPVLGDVGRRALLVAAAEGLARIHALPEEVVPFRSVGAWRERVRRCADRNVARLSERGGVAPSLLGEVRSRIRRGLDALPAQVRLAPCHGSPGLREIAVERRAFAGWRDFEAVRVSDPWLDLAHLAFAVEGPESTPQACALIAAYRAGWGALAGSSTSSIPPDAADRLAFYITLIAAAGVAGLDPDEEFAVSLALETALAWDCRGTLSRAV